MSDLKGAEFGLVPPPLKQEGTSIYYDKPGTDKPDRWTWLEMRVPISMEIELYSLLEQKIKERGFEDK